LGSAGFPVVIERAIAARPLLLSKEYPILGSGGTARAMVWRPIATFGSSERGGGSAHPANASAIGAAANIGLHDGKARPTRMMIPAAGIPK